MDPLLNSIGMRRYSRPEQLYELAEACLEHLCLCVRLMRESGAHLVSHPGNVALRHLLSPSSILLHELMTHVLGATTSLQPTAAERLAGMVEDSAAGPAAERAVVRLFELLTTVCEGDEAWVDAYQRQQAAVAPLHSLIMRQPAWALQLVQFAEPGAAPALQRGAVRMAGFLSTRDATFTHKLLRFQPRRLVYHCAATLSETLFDGTAPDEAPTTAGLLLRVMLDNVSSPFPNFAQLLLGYTVHQVSFFMRTMRRPRPVLVPPHKAKCAVRWMHTRSDAPSARDGTRTHVQGEDALLRGPTRHGPACLTPLLSLLRLKDVSAGAMGAYGAAWLLMHRVTSARWDGDALLSRLLADGTLVCALTSTLWRVPDEQARLARSSWRISAAVVACLLAILGLHIPQACRRTGSAAQSS